MKERYDIIQKDIYRNGKKIYAKLYVPETDRFPLAIFSHGLGGVHEGSADFADLLVRNGIATCIFDFGGGSYESKSDGKTTEMSVLTEADDLEAVIDELKKDARITKVFLAGKSQGAYVSTIVAARRPKEISGVIGLYPGFILYDLIKEEMEKYDELPETYELLWLEVGKIYFEDILKDDIYELMKKYPGKVLLIHGDQDELVTTKSVEKARECFPDAWMVVLKGAKHGFHGPEREEVLQMVLKFIQDNIF